MERASIRDLHMRTSEPVKAAGEGAVVVIERGEPIAELRPLTKNAAKNRRKLIAKMFAWMAAIWKRMPQVDTDSGRFLEPDR